jgi:Protein ENHANCED DISEASE RESISTANCE 2, C-terminal
VVTMTRNRRPVGLYLRSTYRLIPFLLIHPSPIACQLSTHLGTISSDSSSLERIDTMSENAAPSSDDPVATTEPSTAGNDDEEWKIAQAMALAIQANPHMTQQEIRALTASMKAGTTESNDSTANATPSTSLFGNTNVGAGLRNMFSNSAVASTLSSFTANTAASISSAANIVDPSTWQGPSIVSTRLEDESKTPVSSNRKAKVLVGIEEGSEDIGLGLEPPVSKEELPPAIIPPIPLPRVDDEGMDTSTGSGASLQQTSASTKTGAPASFRSKSRRKLSTLLSTHTSVRNVRSPPVSPNDNNTIMVRRRSASSDDVAGFIQDSQPPGISSSSSMPTTSASPLLLPLDVKDDTKVRLSGIAWKRRSGFGKFSTTAAWERRRIELRGTKLYYYRAANNNMDGSDEQRVSTPSGGYASGGDDEGVVPVNVRRSVWFPGAEALFEDSGTTDGGPRGSLDLAKERATVHTAFGHSSAPSPFCISIKVKAETKWKFCFDQHRCQMEWLAALTDVVVSTSVDSYNAQLLELAASGSAGGIASTTGVATGSVYFPPPAATKSPGTVLGGGQNTLWTTEPYAISTMPSFGFMPSVNEHIDTDDDDDSRVSGSRDVLLGAANKISDDEEGEEDEDDVFEHKTKRLVEQKLLNPTVLEEQLEEDCKTWSVPQVKLWHLLALVNASMICARSSSVTMEGFWYLVVLIHLGLYRCLAKEPDWRKTLKTIDSLTTPISSMAPKQNSRNTIKHSRPTAKIGGDSIVGFEAVDASASEGSPATKKTTKRRDEYIPDAGSSTVQLKEPTDPPVNATGELFAGWRVVPGEIMLVRSHGYLTTKNKIPSPGTLYDLVRCDVFESPSRYPDMATRVKLPPLPYEDDTAAKTWRAPDVFVISIALPTDPPKLTKSSSDGGGYTVTMYFTMGAETRAILKRVTAPGYLPSSEAIDDPQKSKVNAVRLFEEWCRRAPSDPAFMSRFKVVPNAHNLKEIGMPGWIAKYNGKPFLIKRPGETGFLHSHPELSAMEFDISLHPFPYLAKQGICFMKEKFFHRVLVSFGFVIEGRADDELVSIRFACTSLQREEPILPPMCLSVCL